VYSSPWTRGEGGEVAGGESGGGVDEEGGDGGEAVDEGGDLQGSATAVTGCAQRQRVLPDEELENGGVAVVPSSPIKGRAPTDAGVCQQAPLPRVELGLRDHQLIEYQWRPVVTGVYDGSERVFGVLEEDLIDNIAVCKAVQASLGCRPITALH